MFVNFFATKHNAHIKNCTINLIKKNINFRHTAKISCNSFFFNLYKNESIFSRPIYLLLCSTRHILLNDPVVTDHNHKCAQLSGTLRLEVKVRGVHLYDRPNLNAR